MLLEPVFPDPGHLIEEPPVVAAPDPLGADQTILPGGATVGTVQLQQSHDPAQVAEHHQFLPQDFDPQRKVVQVVGKANRLPVAAEVFAARRAWADMGERGVLLICME